MGDKAGDDAGDKITEDCVCHPEDHKGDSNEV